MRRALPVLLLFCCVACAKSPEARWESREQRRQERERYAPPADGRLSEPQIRAFLAVAREGAAARRSPSGDSSDTDPFFVPEASAVRKLRLNLEEYLWVKQRVVEAEILADEIEARRKNSETYRKTIAALRAVTSASADPSTRETVSRQLAELEQEAAENDRALRRALPADAAGNLALVGRYRRDIDSASRPAARP